MRFPLRQVSWRRARAGTASLTVLVTLPRAARSSAFMSSGPCRSDAPLDPANAAHTLCTAAMPRMRAQQPRHRQPRSACPPCPFPEGRFIVATLAGLSWRNRKRSGKFIHQGDEGINHQSLLHDAPKIDLSHSPDHLARHGTDLTGNSPPFSPSCGPHPCVGDPTTFQDCNPRGFLARIAGVESWRGMGLHPSQSRRPGGTSKQLASVVCFKEIPSSS